jgi:predicted GNAT family acetyltransferase
VAEPTVINNSAAHQFEIPTGDGCTLLRYIQRGNVLELVHTEVAPEYAGMGLGSALVRTALDYARANKLTVLPTCPFVRSWLASHHEYDDLLGKS